MRNPGYAVHRGNWWIKNASAEVVKEYRDCGEKRIALPWRGCVIWYELLRIQRLQSPLDISAAYVVREPQN